MTSSKRTLRAALAILAVGVASITAGHAANNHDCQAFRAPARTIVAQHDRAPGPAQRAPN